MAELGIIQLRFCRIERRDWGCATFFEQGEVGAWPDEGWDYKTVAAHCGYGDDLHAYCREHDFCHEFLSEELAARPSPVLIGHMLKCSPPAHVWIAEEALVQTFQRFLRADERPLIGYHWEFLKARALAHLRAWE